MCDMGQNVSYPLEKVHGKLCLLASSWTFLAVRSRASAKPCMLDRQSSRVKFEWDTFEIVSFMMSASSISWETWTFLGM